MIKVILHFILITIFTTISQIGGLIYLLSLLTFRWVNERYANVTTRCAVKFLIFTALYLTFTFLVVPFIAPYFGRVSMPVFETRHLKPLNLGTCLLNRHYVKPELKEAVFVAAENLHRQYPGSVVNYLDANFPFIDKFPLFPHLSHNDGKKLDIAFFYKSNNQITSAHPSLIGYGVCEEPKNNEHNAPAYCSEKGYWQYSFLKAIIPQNRKNLFQFDEARTRKLISEFVQAKSIGKIFIEPHLKTRLKLTNEKIRFHGCQAVRHDDHIHVQLL